MNGVLSGFILGVLIASITACAVVAISARRRSGHARGTEGADGAPGTLEPLAPAPPAPGAPDVVFNDTVTAAVVAGGWTRATWVAPTFAAVTGLDPELF